MASAPFTVRTCRTGGVTAVEAHTAHAFGRHLHEQFGIGVIEAGAQRSASGRGMVEAQAGDTITVNAGEVHDGMPLDGQPRAWRMLYFDPAHIAAAAADLSEGAAGELVFEHPAQRNAETARRFRKLYRAMTDLNGIDHTTATLACDESLLLLLDALLETRPATTAPDTVGRAQTRIDDDPAGHHSLADLAGEANLSRFQLVRAFARATGLTPHAYLLQRRINLARRLIADGMALSSAAMATGFADQSHMTRLFVRSFGITPARFAAAMA